MQTMMAAGWWRGSLKCKGFPQVCNREENALGAIKCLDNSLGKPAQTSQEIEQKQQNGWWNLRGLCVKEALKGNHKKQKGVVGESGKGKLDKLQEHGLKDSRHKMLWSSSGITGLQSITWMLEHSHNKWNQRQLWSVLAPSKTHNALKSEYRYYTFLLGWDTRQPFSNTWQWCRKDLSRL